MLVVGRQRVVVFPRAAPFGLVKQPRITKGSLWCGGMRFLLLIARVRVCGSTGREERLSVAHDLDL